MGLGKTFVGSEKMYELNTPYNLVICQKSKISDWKEHFKEFYPTYKVVIFNKQSLDIIPEETVLIVNYDKVWRRPELLKLNNFTMMLDESSLIKNEKSSRSKFILQLKATNVILLSGTPTGGKYEELWSQLHLLGWTISKKLYIKQYVEQEWDEENGGFKIIGYKNVERLKQKLRIHGAVFMKTEEVFNLPPQNEVLIKLPNTKEYKHFQSENVAQIKGELFVGDSVAKSLLGTRLLAGYLNQHKVSKLKDMITSTNDRLIIFYNYKAEYEEIKKLCDELSRPVATMNGSLKDMSNYDKHENSISLIQYQAGAMGLNLQKANKIIYFTLPLSSELFEQSKKRTHRIGQEKPCFYYYMLVLGTIEWHILETLKMRKDYTDDLFIEKEVSYE